MSPRSRYGRQCAACRFMIARSSSVRVWAKSGRGAMRRKTNVGMWRTLRESNPGRSRGRVALDDRDSGLDHERGDRQDRDEREDPEEQAEAPATRAPAGRAFGAVPA